MKNLNYNTEKKLEMGYVTLISVLIFGAVSLAIVVTLLLSGVGRSQTSFTFERSNQAKAYANACVEEALQQIRDSTPYTGTSSLSFSTGSCNYTVENDGGQARTITAEGEVGSVVRKVNVEIDSINPEINVISWSEVADF